MVIQSSVLKVILGETFILCTSTVNVPYKAQKRCKKTSSKMHETKFVCMGSSCFTSPIK